MSVAGPGDFGALVACMALGIIVRVECGKDTLGAVLSGIPERRGWGLELMGEPLVLHALRNLAQHNGGVEGISVDDRLDGVADLLRRQFEGVAVSKRSGPGGPGEFVLPSDGTITRDPSGKDIVLGLHEPWELLDAALGALRDEVKETRIAASAEVAKTAVISGPCVVGEGAKIDDFCKISGPVFIGPRTKVWTGSLVRESMVGPDCEIGFGCEVGRTYMLGSDRIAHHDVILDSVLGRGVWMGAFIGTTNKLLNNATVKYMKEGRLVDTGRLHFGAVFGSGCGIGAGTILLPGRYVPPAMIVQANTLYSGR